MSLLFCFIFLNIIKIILQKLYLQKSCKYKTNNCPPSTKQFDLETKTFSYITTISHQNQRLVQCYRIILTLHSDVTSCSSNVLYSKRIHSHIAFSCQVSSLQSGAVSKSPFDFHDFGTFEYCNLFF